MGQKKFASGLYAFVASIRQELGEENGLPDRAFVLGLHIVILPVDPESIGLLFGKNFGDDAGRHDRRLGLPDLGIVFGSAQNFGERPIADRRIVLFEQPADDLSFEAQERAHRFETSDDVCQIIAYRHEVYTIRTRRHGQARVE